MFKTSLLSLAAISFLATQASAEDLKISRYSEALNSQANTNNARSITNGGSCDESNTNCTINDSQTSNITISDGGTLTIEKGGTLEVSSGQGILANSGTAIIQNDGTIHNSSSGNGIQFKGNNSNNRVAGTIINNGIITAGIDKKNNANAAININSNATANLIQNSGYIQSNNGFAAWSNSITETLINTGTIESITDTKYYDGTSGNGILVKSSTLNNLINSGIIKGQGELGGGSYGAHGIFFYGAKFQTITNEEGGLIYSKNNNGIQLEFADGQVYTQGKLVDNKGTIQASNGSGISVITGTTVETIKNSGIIEALNGIKFQDFGYSARGSVSVGTIENSGTINATQDGIIFTDHGGNNGKIGMTIGNLTSTGTIIAGRYGINIADTTKNAYQIGKITLSGKIYGGVAGLYIGANQKLTEDITITGGTLSGGTTGILNYGTIGNTDGSGGIKLKDGASISSGTNSETLAETNNDTTNTSQFAIYNAGDGIIYGDTEISNGSKITGGIYNTNNAQLIGDIKVSGENSAITGGLTNSGSGKITGSIILEKGGSIDKVENLGNAKLEGSISVDTNSKLDSIVNEGTMTGGITTSSNSSIEITNTGDIGTNNGNNITIDGTGGVTIKDWVVGSNNDGTLESIQFGGKGSGKVNVESITIDTSDANYNANKDISVEDILKGSSGMLGDVGTVNSGSNLIKYKYNPITGKYESELEVAQGMGAILSQTLINTFVMRSFFIDTVLDDAARMVGKHSRVVHNEHKNMKNFKVDEHYHGFVLPYYSYNKVKLFNTTDTSTGHTKGIIAGFHTLRDIGVLGAYIGTEKAQMSTGDYFNLDMQTVYAGLRYGNAFLIDDKKSVFVKAQTKISYTSNDMAKYISTKYESATGSNNTYGYGASIGTGLNFYAKGTDRLITPEFSFNYEGGTSTAFSMVGPAALGHERYYQSKLNLFSTTASIKWLEQWNSKFATSLAGGARLNLNPEVNSKVNFANKIQSDDIDIPRTFQFIQSSLIFSLTKDIDISLNYNGTFSSHADSHTGYLQFDFIF